jgi:hypothetical protein
MKTKKLLCWIGTFIVIVIVLWQRSDWQRIGLGFLAFMAGSALLVWTDESKEGRSSKNLKWLKGILVPFILASGGFLTTQGWNMRDNYFHDRAILKSLAREWKLNNERNREIEFNRDRIREEKFSRHRPFPLPTHSQIERAIDITAFRLPSLNPSLLQLQLFQYIIRIDHLSVRLEGINHLVGEHDDYTRGFEQTFGEGDAYPKYLETHCEVERLLRETDPWLFEEIDNLKIKWTEREPNTDIEEQKPAGSGQSTDSISQAGLKHIKIFSNPPWCQECS